MSTSVLGRAVCKNHAALPATWKCAQCHSYWCDDCTKRLDVAMREVRMCPCGGHCRPPAPGDQGQLKRSYLSLLPETFIYPLRGDGLILITAGTIFFTALKLVGFHPIIIFLGIFILGYLGSYFMSIIMSTAQGRDELPDWPDFSTLWDSIFFPAFLLISNMICCYLPALLWALAIFRWQWMAPSVVSMAVLVLLALGGYFLLQMGFIAGAMMGTVTALNPLGLVRSIARLPGDYCLLWAFFLVVSVVSFAAHVIVWMLHVPIYGGIIADALSFYFAVVNVRAMGLLYRVNSERLAWYES